MKFLLHIKTTIIFLIIINPIIGQNNWHLVPIPDSLEPTYINAEMPDYLFISAKSNNNYGLYRSSDKGLTWKTNNLNISGKIAKVNDSSLVAGGMPYLYRSDNLGESWYQTGSPGTSGNFIKVDTEENIYIGGWGLLIRSIDGGFSWDTLLLTDNVHCFHDIEFGESGVIFLATGRFLGPPHGGFYRSLDNGLSWEHIGIINKHVLTLDKTSDNTLYAGEFYNIYRSSDLGATWDIVVDTIAGYPLIITPGDSIYAGIHVNYGLPIYFSGDLGNTWINFSSGINNFRANFFSLSLEGNLYLFCGTGANRQIYSTYDIGVSVNSLQHSKRGLKIYPNPCHEVIVIEFSCPIQNMGYLVQIYDLTGKLHFIKNIYRKSRFRIELTKLSKGTYLVVVGNQKDTYINKVIKM